MVSKEKQLIRFLDKRKRLEKLLKEKELYIFLDYDGTCTPIVDSPDAALLSAEMQKVIKELKRYYKVAVVTGRTIEDVKSKMGLDGIFYVGSHGFEIIDPRGGAITSKAAQRTRTTIDQVYNELVKRLKPIKGALVEHVKYTVSVHYRLVAEQDLPKVEEAIHDILHKYKSLKRTHGKKVFVLRPRADWDKGKAVNFILDIYRFDRKKSLAIYIGDDITDEDAFRTVRDKGFGILVADTSPSATHAKYILRNSDEVRKVLEFFIHLRK